MEINVSRYDNVSWYHVKGTKDVLTQINMINFLRSIKHSLKDFTSNIELVISPPPENFLQVSYDHVLLSSREAAVLAHGSHLQQLPAD